jgi:hypothetical protein
MLKAPFQIDELKQIVSGEIKSPVIDLANSKIKDQSLLTYIYNLNLADPVISFDNISLADRRNFFLSFLNHKTVVEVSSLTDTYILFLFQLKGITIDDEDMAELSPIFTVEEIKSLMETDQVLRDAIEHAAFLLDGVIVHLMLSFNDLTFTADEEFGKVGVLKDPSWLGHTWVNLFKNPVFSAYYYSVMPPLRELVYFTYQYSEPIYKGKVLFDYLQSSPFVSAMLHVAIKNLQETPA